MVGAMEFDKIDPLFNEFTGSARESLEPPAHDEPVCLISYEITYILLGDGPNRRRSFWKIYRRELKLNRDTAYRNYHVNVCQHQLVSLRLPREVPVYFRTNRLTTERQLDVLTCTALTDPRFN